MKSFFLLVVAIVVVIASSVSAQIINYPSGQPDQPIVGILSQPNRHSWSNLCGQYVQQTYVDWFASVGVRAVPIPYDISPSDLQTLLGNLNGALFTGGGLDLEQETTFYATAKAVYQYAEKTAATNDPNGKFVLWGTCQGFQLISIIASGDDFSILHCDYVGTDNSMLPLDLTDQANSSRFFAGLDNGDFAIPKMRNYFTKYNSTGNAHQCGVTPSVYSSNANLNKSLNVLSTNVDTAGKPFASMYEHKNGAEIYGSQWHPEGQTFWYIDNWPKTPAAIETGHYAGFFLASRLRLNKHTFPNVQLNSDTDNAVDPNSWMSTFVKQYPVVENPEKDYSGFYCVGGYPGSQLDQSLQRQVSDYKHDRDIFAALFFVLVLISVFGSLFACMKFKQLRREQVLQYGSHQIA